ncbi:MAG: sigma-54-dependent Fis family transcriptional regulator, partial [Verrucomicrobiota bacterium]
QWPGNVRELEQATRRVLLTHNYQGDHVSVASDRQSQLIAGIQSGDLTANALLANYCKILHDRYGTYEKVAQLTELDRRTAKKYIDAAEES